MSTSHEPTVWSAIEGMRIDIHNLVREGCAKREGDMNRIDTIERVVESHGKKLDKIYYTSLVTAGGIIAFLIKSFFPLFVR